ELGDARQIVVAGFSAVAQLEDSQRHSLGAGQVVGDGDMFELFHQAPVTEYLSAPAEAVREWGSGPVVGEYPCLSSTTQLVECQYFRFCSGRQRPANCRWLFRSPTLRGTRSAR